MKQKVKLSRTFSLLGVTTLAATLGECTILVSQEPSGWHLSIAHGTRNPTWEEIRQARYELVPGDVTMAMLLPPVSEYINVHEYCFHLYETKDERILVSTMLR